MREVKTPIAAFSRLQSSALLEPYSVHPRVRINRAAHAILTKLKLRLRLEDWQRAWPVGLVGLGVVVTFCWMALLAYGVISLISRSI
jgi:hypothetical protein